MEIISLIQNSFNGYGSFVVSAFAITFFVLLINLFLPFFRHKNQLKTLKTKKQLEEIT